ncbi:NAD-dependent succinate-semialdehyde dehydrogenase [Arthrobacter crystallopoietes]|uniref:Succinate-semialdehyde dehydrogenase / glutarate-semialdehyde dehydrogenase n=1 Tax=Crystallibacter crystallopoietes TaxID=37928 RepID=A0A1H1DTJ6_9MICC|nr:NAD-dependent succinate-semialdehyde dehydrogenase [Arthrobacter crystallopoietes]AUI50174.1 succinate-semialdehyde dehydrogenase [Arthrobacter crystallopoietes]SDQ79794.1 succinate-semialdehyde dehydrogenase / glutarate-semialdehyde dehydrogenase [Arthrobacter crystallopoietes]
MTLYAVTNPATGETVKEYPTATDVEIQTALERTDNAFRRWTRSPLEERVKLLNRVAELYEERRDELAAIITREMGKPIRQAGFEVDIVASIYRYYAENGPKFLADEELDVVAGGKAVVRREGLGVLLGIMPWNYPYYQVARFAAPNLMNGNTILLKHAPQCPESALAMEQIFKDAGAPEGSYVNIFATNEQVGNIIADPRVQGVSLTGSERAGAAVAEIAGRNLKKVVLELGGSDPFLLLDTKDLDKSVKTAVFGRMTNGGQACNASKRFVVLEDIYDEFVEKFSSALAAITPGDPTNPKTYLGPLSSQAAADNLAKQVDSAVAEGAVVRTGGGKVSDDSAFFQPTVLTDVTPDMAAFREELFGPVAMVFKASSEDEAIRLANDTPFGLGASIHTNDAEKAQRIAEQIEAGMVYINEPGGTAAELPFGGVKRSGVGRELGKYGMDEFINKKLVRTSGR